MIIFFVCLKNIVSLFLNLFSYSSLMDRIQESWSYVFTWWRIKLARIFILLCSSGTFVCNNGVFLFLFAVHWFQCEFHENDSHSYLTSFCHCLNCWGHVWLCKFLAASDGWWLERSPHIYEPPLAELTNSADSSGWERSHWVCAPAVEGRGRHGCQRPCMWWIIRVTYWIFLGLPLNCFIVSGVAVLGLGFCPPICFVFYLFWFVYWFASRVCLKMLTLLIGTVFSLWIFVDVCMKILPRPMDGGMVPRTVGSQCSDFGCWRRPFWMCASACWVRGQQGGQA